MKKIVMLFGLLSGVYSCSSDSDSGKKTTDDDGPVVTDVLTPENVRSYMADANATDETVALFYNLYQLQKTKFLVGQQDAFNGFYNNASGNSDIKKATGNDPALLGSDFMFITDDKNTGEPTNWFYQQELLITADAKEAYDKGMVNTFCWHFREPYEGESFYTADMTEQQKQNAFISLLPGGENHNYYKEKLDKIAGILNNLKGSDGKLIPVIFRPFHEFDGNWFWWGSNYCTPAQYKELWQFTVNYLKDTKQVHNVLYAFSPDNSYTQESQYLSRYPGDDYVDVLGMDNYGDFSQPSVSGTATANSKLKMVASIAKQKVKIAAMTETGLQVNATEAPVSGFFTNYMYNALSNNSVEVAYVMFWANSQAAYYVPPAGQPNTQDFVDFTKKPKAVLQNNIPYMYTITP